MNKPLFTVGEVVRLVLNKQKAFEKGYTAAYSTELYRIKRVVCGPPTYRYKLADLTGTTISNSYYAEELVRYLQ